MTQSSAGKWDYTQCHHAASYGDDTTYRLAAKWLEGLSVEDWGCGLGWFKKFHAGGYLGIDGSKSEASDVVGDLVGRTQASCQGVLVRHMLEHNACWELLLRNALRTFEKRLCIVVFTPFEDVETFLTPTWAPIPDISLPRERFVENIWRADAANHVTVQHVPSKTRYGAETVLLVEKKT